MDIVQRLLALGLNKPLALRLELLVTEWANCSGPEWTVNRLKSLKVELINRLAGRQQVVPWVRRNKDGLPSGPISELFRLAEKNKRGRFIAINAIMVYSSFVSEKVTDTQREKFFSSMSSDDETGLTLHPKKGPLYSVKKLKDWVPWTNVPLSSRSFQPGPDGKSYQETDTFMSLMFALTSRPIFALIRRYSNVFNRVIPVSVVNDMWREGTAELKYSTPPVNMCVGKISYIQEPGYKLRAVANPSRVIQAALEPLKEALGNVVRTLSNDYTFDQDAGVKRVQQWLKEGLTVHSVDLSDATNLFPLPYQIGALETRVVLNEGDKEDWRCMVNIFNEVARSPWFSKENGEVKTHVFTRGQPLGLGPSFFAFAFAHNILLTDLCRNHKLPESFVILGDDVCIANDRLAVLYRQSLDLLGCKVSESKTLVSPKVAEFAGKIILADEIIPQFKWHELSDANVVDFCRNVGPKSVNLLSRRQALLIKALADVPDFLGGLGWNPNGIPLTERLRIPLCSFLLSKDAVVNLPMRRVDAALISFMHDERVKELTPLYITVNSGSTLIPSRESGVPRWSYVEFWDKFTFTQSKHNLLPEYVQVNEKFRKGFLFLDSNSEPVTARECYTPFVKDSGKPGGSVETPWFDVIRYFERNRSRIDASSIKQVQ